MHIKPIFSKDPVFIPALNFNENCFVEGKKLPATFVNANIEASYPNPIQKIKKSSDVFILDPMTNFFIESSYKDTSTFEKLTTAPVDPIELSELITNEGMRRDFVAKNIDNQVRAGANIILTPYVYAESVADTKFALNLTLVTDSIKYVRSNDIKTPLYVMINIGSGILNNIGNLNLLIDRYLEDISSLVQGYFVMVNDCDCKKIDVDQLMGLAHFSFQLAKDNDVFFIRMNDFGEILTSLGASGYVSGVAQGDTFKAEKLFAIIKSAFGRKHKEVTYVPELFDYVNDEELKRMKYKCACNICNGGLPGGYTPSRKHFLERKIVRMDELSKLDKDGRRTFMKLKIEEAINLAEDNNKKHALSLKTDFLYRWKKVLINTQNWEYSEKEEELLDLDKIINEAKENK